MLGNLRGQERLAGNQSLLFLPLGQKRLRDVRARKIAEQTNERSSMFSGKRDADEVMRFAQRSREIVQVGAAKFAKCLIRASLLVDVYKLPHKNLHELLGSTTSSCANFGVLGAMLAEI
eukprot:1161352-Pelagomonas_calceolata.AAC.4